jgi:DHA3 family tetracycline resistance protein-like MFS transporter
MRDRGAFHVYLVLSGVSSLGYTLIFTVNLVYQATVIGLSPLQMVLVGTFLETVAFISEVPTGIVADVYSRRLSVIIGVILVGAGFVLEGLVPTFTAVLVAQLLWGVGVTFTSGATEAWIADEVGEELAGRAFLRGAQIERIAGAVGIAGSVALASLHLSVPVVAGGALMIGLGGYLLVSMPERGFTPAPREDRSSWGQMRHTFHDGLRVARGRPILLTLLGVSLVAGLASEVFDRLWQVYLLQSFVFPRLGRLEPVVWFGIISMVGMVLGLAGTEIARRRGVESISGQTAARLLLLLSVVRIGGVLGFALAGNFGLALMAFWFGGVVSAISEPVNLAWFNRNLESRSRATVLSMHNQLNAVGQIAGGPILGSVASLVSIRAALIASGLTLFPVPLLYARAARLEENEGGTR